MSAQLFLKKSQGKDAGTSEPGQRELQETGNRSLPFPGIAHHVPAQVSIPQ